MVVGVYDAEAAGVMSDTWHKCVALLVENTATDVRDCTHSRLCGLHIRSKRADTNERVLNYSLILV